MKALSVKQPWAGLILEGMKTLECRTWTTRYRGKILICASLKEQDDDLWAHLPDCYAYGVTMCVADLVDVRPARATDIYDTLCQIHDGDFVWQLKNIRPVVQRPIKGQLGLFNVKAKDLVRYRG